MKGIHLQYHCLPDVAGASSENEGGIKEFSSFSLRFLGPESMTTMRFR